MILKISLDFRFLPMITATLLYLSVMKLSETVGDRHHYIHDWEFFAFQFFSIISIILGASQAQESELTCAETGCIWATMYRNGVVRIQSIFSWITLEAGCY
jgi:uncharacterized membrane protein